MSQFSDKLLHYMQSEYLASGKDLFPYIDMLSCISDQDQLERAITTLEASGNIESEYISSYRLLTLPD